MAAWLDLCRANTRPAARQPFWASAKEAMGICAGSSSTVRDRVCYISTNLAIDVDDIKLGIHAPRHAGATRAERLPTCLRRILRRLMLDFGVHLGPDEHDRARKPNPGHEADCGSNRWWNDHLHHSCTDSRSSLLRDDEGAGTQSRAQRMNVLDTSVNTILIRRGRQLQWFTIAWNSLEGLVSIAAGAMAGSVSLLGFRSRQPDRGDQRRGSVVAGASGIRYGAQRTGRARESTGDWFLFRVARNVSAHRLHTEPVAQTLTGTQPGGDRYNHPGPVRHASACSSQTHRLCGNTERSGFRGCAAD